MFSIVQSDGHPALFVSGTSWGALITKQAYSNYHLGLWFKWGKRVRPTNPLNSGILYHSHGPLGGFMNTWMNSIEFDMMENVTGMMAEVGDDIHVRSEVGEDGKPGSGFYRYMMGGTSADFSVPVWVRPTRDMERPQGEWNKLDLYVVGDRAMHVVNGVPVVGLTDIASVDSTGRRTPLTGGRIQLQSEGVEVYFRDITIQPIRKMPGLATE